MSKREAYSAMQELVRIIPEEYGPHMKDLNDIVEAKEKELESYED